MAGDRMVRTIRLVAQAVAVIGALASAPTLAAAPQPGFNSPDEAVAALVQALQSRDPASVGTVLGPGSEALVRSGDPVKDHQEAQTFLDAYAAHHALAPDGPARMVLHVGTNDWPMPIPLVEQNGAWRFDSHAGAQQIIDRRIGRNEIAAIRFCLAYVDAQKAYFDLFQQVTGAGTYAQRLVSTSGNYDGLYWPSAADIPDSPLAALVASAVQEGYPGEIEAGKPVPYEGYYYRILTAQGPNAPGGSRSYLRGGRMVEGFGLIAWPATYGASGIMTFIVDQDGIVFQQDLGRNTTARSASIKAFDSGLEWTRVDVGTQ
jgi:hypothetical protein